MPIPVNVYAFSRDKNEDYCWRPTASSENIIKEVSEVFDELDSGPFVNCAPEKIHKIAIFSTKKYIHFLICDLLSEDIDFIGRQIKITGFMTFEKYDENILWILNVIYKLFNATIEKVDADIKNISRYLLRCFTESKTQNYEELPLFEDKIKLNDEELKESFSRAFEEKKTIFQKLDSIGLSGLFNLLGNKKIYRYDNFFIFTGNQIDEIFIKKIQIPAISIGKSLLQTETKTSSSLLTGLNNLFSKIKFCIDEKISSMHKPSKFQNSLNEINLFFESKVKQS